MNQNEQLGDRPVEPTTKDNTISGSLTETPSSVPHMLSKQSLKRSLPTSPDSDIADSSVTMSALSQQRADVQSSTPPPEGVNPAVWEMLWSIKHDTARAISLGESLDHRLLILEDSHDNVGTEISILKRTVADIVKSNQVLCGRLFRAEKTIERQRTEITDLRMRSMRDNVIIRSKGSDYKEMRGENTSSIFKRFLDKELHVPNSEHITISSSHRMGQAVGDANKMIIARLPFAEDRKRIFDNVKSLKGTGMSVLS